MDDGSTDDTAAIAESFAARDPGFDYPPDNAGSAAARNPAIAQARGESSRSSTATICGCRSFSRANWSFSPRIRSWIWSAATPSTLVGPLTANRSNRSRLLANISLLDLIGIEDSVCIMSVFRRRLVERTGGFDPSAKNNEDYDLWVRAACAGCHLAFNPFPDGYYRRHAGASPQTRHEITLASSASSTRRGPLCRPSQGACGGRTADCSIRT